MLTLLQGDNQYERDRYLAAHASQASRIEGGVLDSAQLRQYLQGVSLFLDQQIVIIDSLSENKPLWDELGSLLTDYLAKQASVILVETKPDKRTKTYKALQKYATVVTCDAFGERDTSKAAQWLMATVKEQGGSIEASAAAELVARVGVDQYRLLHEYQRLAVLGEVTLSVVQTYTPASPKDTAFNLLATALSGDITKLRHDIQAARALNDPYRLMGLLVSQVYALAGLVLSPDTPSSNIAKALGVHPFVLRNLQPVARRCSSRDLRTITQELAEADVQLKTSDRDPWLVLELALLTVAKQRMA